jgi:uncharacterized protein (TIGR00730 family)
MAALSTQQCYGGRMRSVCVFLSSTSGTASTRAEICALGRELAARRITLIYGGASVGLMGLLADATLAAGGSVIGVIPRTLVDREVAHHGLTQLFIVDTMHERKAKMAELADAFIVAPGGFGTLEEAFEILTGQQIAVHDKPVAFLDVDQFWAPMESFLAHAVAALVLRPENFALFVRCATASLALDRIGQHVDSLDR